jgi:hypothetical protein
MKSYKGKAFPVLLAIPQLTPAPAAQPALDNPTSSAKTNILKVTISNTSQYASQKDDVFFHLGGVGACRTCLSRPIFRNGP